MISEPNIVYFVPKFCVHLPKCFAHRIEQCLNRVVSLQMLQLLTVDFDRQSVCLLILILSMKLRIMTVGSRVIFSSINSFAQPTQIKTSGSKKRCEWIFGQRSSIVESPVIYHREHCIKLKFIDAVIYLCKSNLQWVSLCTTLAYETMVCWESK